MQNTSESAAWWRSIRRVMTASINISALENSKFMEALGRCEVRCTYCDASLKMSGNICEKSEPSFSRLIWLTDRLWLMENVPHNGSAHAFFPIRLPFIWCSVAVPDATSTTVEIIHWKSGVVSLIGRLQFSGDEMLHGIRHDTHTFARNTRQRNALWNFQLILYPIHAILYIFAKFPFETLLWTWHGFAFTPFDAPDADGIYFKFKLFGVAADRHVHATYTIHPHIPSVPRVECNAWGRTRTVVDRILCRARLRVISFCGILDVIERKLVQLTWLLWHSAYCAICG